MCTSDPRRRLALDHARMAAVISELHRRAQETQVAVLEGQEDNEFIDTSAVQ